MERREEAEFNLRFFWPALDEFFCLDFFCFSFAFSPPHFISRPKFFLPADNIAILSTPDRAWVRRRDACPVCFVVHCAYSIDARLAVFDRSHRRGRGFAREARTDRSDLKKKSRKMSDPMDVSTTVVLDPGLESRSVNVVGGSRVALETQTHAVGLITPPPDIRAIVDKTAQFVARNGPEFETRILGSEKNNAKFNFLVPADPYNAYYKSRIAGFKEEAAGGDAASIASKAGEAAKAANEESGTVAVATAGSAKPKVLQAPKKEQFCVDFPDGVASFDLDVLKLTAQFAARHGSQFITQLAKKEQGNKEFAFLKTTHSMHSVFQKFADAYAKVLHPPKGLDAVLKKETEKSFLLERALQRLEWERSVDSAKRSAEEEVEKEREAFALVDWHDFAVVETIDFEDGEDDDLPEPMTLRDIVAQARDAEAPVEATGPASGSRRDVKPAETGHDDEGDVPMDEEERAMIAEGVAAAAAPRPAPVGMKIVRDHKKPEVLAAEAKARSLAGPGGADATKFAVSPITGELIAVDDMAEHMRVSLIDPKWKTQKAAMLAKLKGGTKANDDEVAANILSLARTRPDIFGTGNDAEVSDAVAESIQARKQAGPPFKGVAPPPAPDTSAGASLRPGMSKMPPPPPAARVTPVMPPPPAPVAASMPAPPPPAPGPALKASPASPPHPAPVPASAIASAAPAPVPAAPTPVPAPDLVLEETVDESKKRKIGETELLEELDFLDENPGSGIVCVRCPDADGDEHMNGQIIDLAVDSLSLPVAEFKKLVKDALGGLAANKQKISAPGLGFLVDKKTLAFYNLGFGTVVTLTLKERGGRKK